MNDFREKTAAFSARTELAFGKSMTVSEFQILFSGKKSFILFASTVSIARAYRWQELLDNGEFDSPEALAAALGVNVSYVRRFLRLALLAPQIVEAIMAGKAPRTLSLTKLDTNLPFSWQEQLKLFGMA